MTSNVFSDYCARLSHFMARARSGVYSREGDPDLAKEFEALAGCLFRLQFEHNLVYRNFCLARGVTPENVTTSSIIPAVPVDAFKGADFTCHVASGRTAVFYSSGTSGQVPSRHWHSALSMFVYEESLLTGFPAEFAGKGAFVAPVFLTPSAAATPNSSLVHMFETLRRYYDAPEKSFFADVGKDSAWELQLPRLKEFLHRASQLQHPVFVLGTAFSFVHLLDALSAEGRAIRLPPGSRAMETGGYKGRSRVIPKSQLHGLITRWLGIPNQSILCEYGMSELSSQAYDDPAAGRRWFTFPPWARVRVVDPETGQQVAEGGQGIIRVLDLANVGSALALETQDLGIRCGDSFELIGRIADAEPRGCSLMAA